MSKKKKSKRYIGSKKEHFPEHETRKLSIRWNKRTLCGIAYDPLGFLFIEESSIPCLKCLKKEIKYWEEIGKPLPSYLEKFEDVLEGKKFDKDLKKLLS
jgi:hypothetical protein